MSFKEQLASDIDRVFFDSEEFAEVAVIDGHEKKVVIDDEQLKDRGDKEYGGITTGMLLYFIPVASYAPIVPPKIGNTQVFNKRRMQIDDVKIIDGVYEILLNQNRGE